MKHSATGIVFLLGGLVVSAWTTAATLRFDPAGAQLDGDAIFDIALNPGDLITFDVKIDTVGLAGPLVNFSYFFAYDRNELEFVRSALDPGSRFGTDTGPTAANPPPAADATHLVSHTGGAVAAGTALFVLDSFTFRALPGLINDELSDFRIGRSGANVLVGGGLVGATGSFTEFQQVEVQPKVIPLPAAGLAGAVLLGVLGVRRPLRAAGGG